MEQLEVTLLHSINIRAALTSGNTFLAKGIVDVWNSLPDDVVTAPSLNMSTRRLDYHWRNETFLYNYKAPVTHAHATGRANTLSGTRYIGLKRPEDRRGLCIINKTLDSTLAHRFEYISIRQIQERPGLPRMPNCGMYTLLKDRNVPKKQGRSFTKTSRRASASSTRKLMNNIKRRQAEFPGHVMRNGKLEHLLTTGKIEGKRSRGRQRIKIQDGIAAWLGRSTAEMFVDARDRKKWKVMIAYACNRHGN